LLAATKIALEESGLNLDTVNKERVGVFVGSGIGGVEWFERACTAFQREGGGEAGLRFVSPFLIPALISNTATGSLAINYGFKGPNYGVVSACATGTHAISLALKYIRDNDADVIIAGGAEVWTRDAELPLASHTSCTRRHA
jgi:3-oxoacyl-[acyl-carrier-protein] synthase II